MRCPICGEKTVVLETRGNIECVARRRKCPKCGYALYTVESQDVTASLILSEIRQRRYDRRKGVRYED